MPPARVALRSVSVPLTAPPRRLLVLEDALLTGLPASPCTPAGALGLKGVLPPFRPSLPSASAARHAIHAGGGSETEQGTLAGAEMERKSASFPVIGDQQDVWEGVKGICQSA